MTSIRIATISIRIAIAIAIAATALLATFAVQYSITPVSHAHVVAGPVLCCDAE